MALGNRVVGEMANRGMDLGIRTLMVLMSFLGVSCGWITRVTAEDWPAWKGPNRNNLCLETGFPREWPEAGPPLAWKATGIGDGLLSAVSVINSRPKKLS